MPNPFGLFDEGDPTDPTYRASMLPMGTYKNPDGSERLGFAWPGMITEPINALSRLADNSRFPDGRIGIPNPHNLDNQNDALTAVLSMYGGNALNPASRVGNALAERAVSNAGGSETALRAYHGTNRAIEKFRPTTAGIFSDNSQIPATWFSSRPDIASRFAEHTTERKKFGSPNVVPVDIDPSRIKDVEMMYFGPNFPKMDDAIRQAKTEGYHGVRFRRLADHADTMGFPNPRKASDVFAMFGPGSVKSATTGEMLLSDTGRPSLLGGLTPPDDDERRPSLLTY